MEKLKKGGYKSCVLDYPDITPEILTVYRWGDPLERLKMIERTVLALQAKKHQAEKDGFFISKSGKKVDKLGNPRIDCARVIACDKVKSNADNFAKKNIKYY